MDGRLNVCWLTSVNFQDYFYDETYDIVYEDFEYDPNFVDSDGDGCDWYDDCSGYDYRNLLFNGVSTTEGVMTALKTSKCKDMLFNDF